MLAIPISANRALSPYELSSVVVPVAQGRFESGGRIREIVGLAFILQKSARIRSVMLLSHAHQDHCGLVAHHAIMPSRGAWSISAKRSSCAVPTGRLGALFYSHSTAWHRPSGAGITRPRAAADPISALGHKMSHMNAGLGRSMPETLFEALQGPVPRPSPVKRSAAL
jgi:hypothetical protein